MVCTFFGKLNHCK